MQMAASVVANEFAGHGTEEKSKPRPFKLERVGHPEKPNQSLGVDVLEWYPLNVIRRQEGNWGRVGHPPVLQQRNQIINNADEDRQGGFAKLLFANRVFFL